MKSFAELPHPCRALCDRVGSIYSLQKFSNPLLRSELLQKMYVYLAKSQGADNGVRATVFYGSLSK